MGATVVALVLDGVSLYWISVGDSPLYLYRDGELRQLNEDHSLAPQIDYLVRNGMMDPEVGRTHPDRHCLTSVLIGGDIERIDCVEAPLALVPGDVLLVASDGLQSLDDDRIAGILGDLGDAPSNEIADALMAAVDECGDPDQDNVSLSVIRAEPVRKPARSRAPARAAATNRTAEGVRRSTPGVLGRLRESLAMLMRRKGTEEGSTP
jgi:protein phosphatase